MLRIFAMACFAGIVALPQALRADHISVTQPPPGFRVASLELGLPFGGSIAVDPNNTDRLYLSAATSTFGPQVVIAANVNTGTTATITPQFGTIGGIAVLPNGDLAIVENRTSDTIFRARDLNADSDFLDAGEISEMILPILTDGNFTGSQAAVAPPGNAAGIPAGALLIQTADDATSSELLVVSSPAAAPAFLPASGSFFSGFQFNGGFDFDAAGNVLLGVSQFSYTTFLSSGKLVALVNTNGNETIDPGESHVLADETAFPAGLSDLAVTKENVVIASDFSGDLRAFSLPDNLLTGTAAPALWLKSNALYISSVELDSHTKPFAPAASNGARLYVGGFASFPDAATNLLILEPQPYTAARDWELYE